MPARPACRKLAIMAGSTLREAIGSMPGRLETLLAACILALTALPAYCREVGDRQDNEQSKLVFFHGLNRDLLLKASSLVSRGEYKEAVDLYSQAITAHPSVSPAYVARGY